jgi:hypothetical protein
MKKLFSCSAFFRLLPLALCVAAGVFLSSCASTEERANARPAAFSRLSARDKQLVLNGQVREGMDKDAVFIAWGAPDRVFQGRAQGRPFESWVYVAQRTTPAQAGPFYYGPFLGLYPAPVLIGGRGGRRGRFINAGAYYAAAFLYRSEFQVTEYPYKKGVFIDGVLRNYETLTRDSR